MSRESKLAKNTLILAIGTFLPKFASFITMPILTYYLTKAEYGTYDLITVLVSLLLPAATLQIQQAAFRFLIEVKGKTEEIKKIVTAIFAVSIPISLFVLAVMFVVFPNATPILKLWICIYFFADMLVGSARQITRGLQNNLDYSISAIVSALGKLIFAVIFVWLFQMSLLGAVISLALASFVSLVYLIFKVKLLKYISFRNLNKKTVKELLSYSWALVPSSMSLWVMRLSDRFVVTFFMGVAVNAVYSVANKIPSLLTLAQTTFTLAWQENATIASKDSDSKAYYNSMYRKMFDLLAGFFGLLIAATPLLFILLIKGDYDEAYNQIPILFMGMFFYSLCSYLGGIYMAYKDSKSVGVTTLIAAVCNVVIDVALIHFIGLYAASLSTLISYILLYIFRLIDIKKYVTLKIGYKHVLPIFLVLLLECALSFPRYIYFDIANCVIGLVLFWLLNKDLIVIVLKKIKGKLSGSTKKGG